MSALGNSQTTFYQRIKPVVNALQDVMLLDSPRLYLPKKPLVVQWLMDVDEEAPDISTLFSQRCTMVHVKHLKSFRQLLRRGIEAYELWGKHDNEKGHYHTATSDATQESYSVQKAAAEVKVKEKEEATKERDEKMQWYLYVRQPRGCMIGSNG